MRCLVTGATGFVGRYLTEFLLARGNTVCGMYATRRPVERIPGARLVRCDVRDEARLGRIVRQLGPHRVYHLAALSSVQESFRDPRTVCETNFWGTFNLLEAVRHTTPKARVLVVSSGHCYGPLPVQQLPATESHAFCPQSPYALSKAAADLLAGYYFHRYGLHVIRARPFNHTGPGQAAHFVCSDFARQVAAIDLGMHPAKVRVGNLNVARDFSDVRDVVRAYYLLLEKGEAGEAYNVASGRPTSVRKVLQLLASFSSSPFRVSGQRQRMRSGEAAVLYGSHHKLRRATGWKRNYTLRTTLRDLYRYWREKLQAQMPAAS